MTRVAVEHRGWENLTEEQLAASDVVGGYRTGWVEILAAFARPRVLLPTGDRRNVVVFPKPTQR